MSYFLIELGIIPVDVLHSQTSIKNLTNDKSEVIDAINKSCKLIYSNGNVHEANQIELERKRVEVLFIEQSPILKENFPDVCIA
jgi:hypothetical protein